MPTTAESFFSDPRVAQARDLLLSTLQDHQNSLTSIRPPHPDRKLAYDDLLKSFGQSRGGALYYPYLGSGIGNGALVELADGSVKLDMITGIGVHYFGHAHPMLTSAAFDAALRDTIMQGNLQQNVESANLAKTLIDFARRPGAPQRINHCFITSSGAMANENAIKMLFQKHAPADRLLALSGAFAGRSMVMSQITDKAAYRVGLPTVLAVDYIPPYDPEKPDHSTAAAVNRLKELIHRYPGRHAGICVELIQGEGGFYAGTRDFFIPILNVLRENKIAIWFDEIQTFARTTQPFAFQHFGLDDYVDMLTVGKITQVCATLFTDDYVPKPGLVSQTFTASTSAILAAQVILDKLKSGDFFGESGRIMQVRRRIMSHIDRLAAKGWVKGPYAEGAMIAFTPFDGSEATVKKLLIALFDAGVIAFLCGGSPSRIRFLPAVGVVTDDQLDQACNILEQVLAKHADK